MARLRRRSISMRLMMMNMLVSGVALLLACAGFFTYDQITFRQGLVRTLSAQAEIVGSNSVSAILFDDPKSAANTLSALRSSQNITAAGIFTIQRQPLSQFVRNGSGAIDNIPALPPNRVESHWFGGAHVELVREILSEGKPIGFVFLRASLGEIDRRLRRYALIALAVLIISLLGAALASSTFGKSVAGPITQLAETAQEISRDKNYAIRVPALAGQNELTVLVDSFNEMLRQLQASHDELEQRVAERTRELVSANQELEAFSYSVSHDLRGPLDAINGFSYVLLKQPLEPQTREAVESIRASGRRMGVLIDDLLNLSRLTSSAMRSENVDLSAIARAITEDLRRSAPDRKVEFVIAPKAEVVGDAHLLQIVMDNLLRNAWKYTSHHESARIEFGISHENGRTVYFVKDDGSGFEQRSAARLFQPFQRLHSTAEFPGSGVGLATVRRIIQRHGGEVWAQAAVEQGAVFKFTLGSSSASVSAD
ncbi:MAG TPA: ATP-binding protein [Candidatus Sulfotelmatobacter sp.]|nr:ATP-binding protein [Candidatus Sulfotelmatobacter sp.]